MKLSWKLAAVVDEYGVKIFFTFFKLAQSDKLSAGLLKLGLEFAARASVDWGELERELPRGIDTIRLTSILGFNCFLRFP